LRSALFAKSDFFVFYVSKTQQNMTKGKNFQDIEVIQKNVMSALNSIPTTDF